ncbi:solute carrier family 28 member 3-like isoform 4-T7 [Callospermophilus lateralis]|uniref:solute carrier family 28 member 3 isoform X4 n=1 Tax=Callospermophilus lateralis TaxID=76772 RepID=UPI004053934F
MEVESPNLGMICSMRMEATVSALSLEVEKASIQPEKVSMKVPRTFRSDIREFRAQTAGEKNMELTSTAAPKTEGFSNTGFRNEELLENQDISGNSSIRNRVVQSREQGNTKQGEELVNIEQDSLRKEEGEDMEDDQDTHQKGVIWSLLILGIIFWLIFDTAKLGQQQLVSFGGLIMYIILLFIFSKYPTRVYWRLVFWGIGLQFLLGLLILRTNPGFIAFNWLGTQVQIFLGYTDAGARFVFGEKYTDHFFAFKVLPIVIFFSTVMSMLYYMGLMQWIIRKVGWIMLVTMGSSPIESLVAAGNIFVGQTESPLLVRPYLPYITRSELHAIMTAGFATIAGSVLGAYISFGVSSTHLLTASVMSAPASLAVAKLFWPETEKPKVTLKNAMKMENGDSRNLLEAATQGASSSIPLVANITVNLIAFLALLSFVNSGLSWFGNMFDYPQLSFELICSYIFMPFSFMMGVDWQDSFMVGRLIGYKTFFNEFVAYEHLSQLINLRKQAGPKFVNGTQQYMSIRSEEIATYALCGFANIGSLGIVIGGLTSLAPGRKRDIVAGSVRALISGTVACFMTACVAGILSGTPEDINCHYILENAFNSSLPSNATTVVSCCQSLLSSITAKEPGEVIPGGNYNLYFVKSCCKLLNPPTLNCSWIPDTF